VGSYPEQLQKEKLIDFTNMSKKKIKNWKQYVKLDKEKKKRVKELEKTRWQENPWRHWHDCKFIKNGEETTPYKSYLQTEYWRELRNRKLKQSGYKCEICGATNNLQIHHPTYHKKGISILYKEELSDLIVLCKNCHQKQHVDKETFYC